MAILAPANMILQCNHAKNVRSLAKKTLGSILTGALRILTNLPPDAALVVPGGGGTTAAPDEVPAVLVEEILNGIDKNSNKPPPLRCCGLGVVGPGAAVRF